MLLGRLSTRAQPLSVRVDPMDLNRIAVDWSTHRFLPGHGCRWLPCPLHADECRRQRRAGVRHGREPRPGPGRIGRGGLPPRRPFSNPTQGNLTVEQLRAYLRASGLEAQATHRQLVDTGKTVGDEHVYTMEMTLMIPGQPEKKLPKSAAMVPTAEAQASSRA